MQSSNQWSAQSFSVPVDTPPIRCFTPAPSSAGTICLLVSIWLAYSRYNNLQTVTEMASAAAISVGVGLLTSILFDCQKGLRNLLRTDLLCLISIYALTLAEFLFPQIEFADMATPPETFLALNITMVGIACLSIGRHFTSEKFSDKPTLGLKELSSKRLFQVFLFATVLGYLAMLLSVNFNLFKMVEAMLGARFSQPWTRGRLGGWGSLLGELALMRYILPPLAAIIWNRHRAFSSLQLIVTTAVLALTLFYGFTSGTRNIFISYLVTFVLAYVMTNRRNTFKNTVLPILLAGVVATYGSYHMLEFRNIGLRNYIEQEVYASGATRDTFAVDYNLASLGWVADAMPESYDYLGTEVLVWSLAKPVPRALWSGKPEGLSVSIEQIAGAEGWTVAATYLGESYMMAGMFGVVAVSLFFGAIAAWWNRMANRQQSDYALLVYALGFFAAAITMRSMFWFTTAILPVLALIAIRKLAWAK